MREVAYLFERFPSFGQTFCYREVAELERQGTTVHVFSIRQPMDEPAENWDRSVVERVHYLPEEKALVAEVDRVLSRDGSLVWVNSSGEQTPIFLDAEDVLRALPGKWTGISSRAGEGTWCVLRRAG